MSTAKQQFGVGGQSSGTLAAFLVALSTLLSPTACSSPGNQPTVAQSPETGGASSQSPVGEPGSSVAEPHANEVPQLDAVTRAFISSQQAKPRPDAGTFEAYSEQLQSVASAGHVPAFGASNKVLDLPAPTPPTTDPLCAPTPVRVPVVSSSASSSYDGRWPSTASHDGDTTTLWMTAGNSLNEGKDYRPWIQYSFDQVYSLGTMRVFNFDGYEYMRGAKDVEVLVSQDGFTFTSLGYKRFLLGSSTTIDGSTVLTQGATWQSIDLGDVRAKYVKLAIHTNYYGWTFYGSTDLDGGTWGWANGSITGLREVQFYSTIPIVSSSASSSYDSRWPATASYDGDTRTLWMTAGNSLNEGKDYRPWIQYSFDQAYSLGTMRVFNFDGYEYMRGAKDVEVLVSQDGSTFTSLGYKQFLLGSSTTIDGSTVLTQGATWQSFDLGGVPAKDVKLAIHSNYYGWNFYGSPDLDGGTWGWANGSITGLREVQFSTGSCGGKHCGDDRSDGCGGTCAISCGSGEAGCLADADCVGTDLHCVARSPNPSAPRVCAASTCTSNCTAECPCSGGAACTTDGQCSSGFACTNGACTVGANSCHNGVRDGNETGTDCGGSCVACVTGHSCKVSNDCDVGEVCKFADYTQTTPKICVPGGFPLHCNNNVKDADESDVDCGGSCNVCDDKKRCNSDADCGNEVCGAANGACFGEARRERYCWRPECEADTQYSCGSESSLCGGNCDCQTPCDVNAATNTCPFGEVCKSVGKLLFNASQNDICVDPACPSNDPALCGSPDSRCGPNCICVADCSHATCANPSDGCGGVCPGVCATGALGCSDDVSCPSGNVCLENADGTSVCRPSLCAFKTLAPPLCGSANALCGETCPTCTPECNGRQCGKDPGCGQSCGSCGPGTYCSADGQCVAPTVPAPVKVPNGSGGFRVLSRPAPLSTTPIGALDGQFSVSDDGSTLYDIPIQVPPGRAGMEPALTISYGASKANGDLGVGWHLQGLSKITRCPRSYGLDGAAAPIKNGPLDAFCLDGKRLEVLPGSSYGASGAEYRTLIDSFSKIKSFNDAGDGIQLPGFNGLHAALRSLQGPDYFQVWTKEGKLLTFGKTRDSLVLNRTGVRYAWLLNRIEDRSGNTVLVEYTNTTSTTLTHDALGAFGRFTVGSTIHPSVISYTGHGSAAGDRRVVFNYEARDDEQLTFGQGGTTYIGPERLSRITTFVGPDAVRNYRFQYGPGQPSQVEKIYECTGDTNATCKNPTSFEYSSESGFPPVLSEFGIPDIEGAGRLDINGDGVPDHLLTTAQLNGVDSSPTLAAAQIGTDIVIGFGSYLAGPEAGIAISLIWNIIKGDFWGLFGDDPSYTVKHQLYVGSHDRSALQLLDDVGGIHCADIDTSGTRHPTYFTDFDNDGKDDIVTACGAYNGDLYVAKSLGNGQFQSLTHGVTSDGAPVLQSALGRGFAGTYPRGSCPTCQHWAAPVLADINGDSLLDAITCRDHYTLNVWLRQPPTTAGPGGTPSAGDDFARTPLTLSSPMPPLTQGAHGGQPTAPRVMWPLCANERPTFKTFDMDGDGTSDLMVRGPDGWAVLRLSQGTLSFEPLTFTDIGGSKGSAGGNLALADFNGDGLADVWNTTDTTTTVWLNAGGGVFSPRIFPHPNPALAVDSRFKRNATVALDYDADGRSDILENWYGNQNFALSYNASLITSSKVDRFLSANQANVNAYNPLSGHNYPTHFLLTSDFDGDGNTDVLGSGQVVYGAGAAGKLLTKVVDGLGNFTKIKYGGDSYHATCTGVQWPERCLPHASGLVTQHQEGMVTAAGAEVIERTFAYGYTNARVNVTGEGWLGFDQRTVQEYRGELQVFSGGFQQTPISETTIDYEPLARFSVAGERVQTATPPFIYPLAGLPKIITIDQHSTDQFSVISGANGSAPLRSAEFDPRVQTENHWTVKLSASGRPYPLVDYRVTSTYERQVGGVASFADNGSLLRRCDLTLTPDGYGNMKESLERCQAFTNTYTVQHPIGDQAPYTVTESGFLDSTDIKTDYQPDVANWLISFPKTRTVQSKVPDIESITGVPTGGPVVTQLHDDTQSWSFTWLGDQLATATRHAVRYTPAEQERTTVYDRDAYGNVYQITEQVPGQPSRVTHLHFDYDHDLYYPDYIENAAGERTQFQFDTFWGKPRIVSDPSGVTVQSVYDDFGLLREEIGPTGTTITSYAPIANPQTETAAGHVEPRVRVTVDSQGSDGTVGVHGITEYDNRARVVRTTAPVFKGTQALQNRQVIQEQAYDDATGLLLGKTLPYASDPLGLGTLSAPHDTYSYDGLHRPIRITHSDTTYKEYQYASRVSLAPQFQQWLGHLGELTPMGVVRTVDEEGHQNVRITDYRGRIMRSIDGDNTTSGTPKSSNYRYGSFGRLEYTEDNLENLTRFDYDCYGRQLGKYDPDIGYTQYVYTGFDELATVTDPRNRVSTYHRDSLGRVRSLDDADGTTQWTYDPQGRLTDTYSPSTAHNTAGNHIHYEYEPPSGSASPTSGNRSLLQTATYTIEGSTYPVRFDYDGLGRTWHVYYPSLGTGAPIVTKYSYEAGTSALFAVDEEGSGTARNLWQAKSAYEGHLLNDETFGNGAETTYDFDSQRHWLGNVKTVLGSQEIQNIHYTHYDDGQVQLRSPVGANPIEYVYDRLNRLSEVIEHPANGHPQSTDYNYDDLGNIKQHGSITNEYLTNQPHLLNNVGSNFYHYDLNGDVSSRDGPDVPGGQQYLDYTTFNLPKTIQTGEALTTTELEYSADHERLIRRDPDTTVHSVGTLYERKLDYGTTTREERFRIYAGSRQIGEIVRKDGSDRTLYFHADHLGSIDTVSDSDGAWTQQDFDPFGKPAGNVSSPLTRSGFTGQDHDLDLALIDMKGRSYDPLAARFVSPDPLTQAPFWSQGLNRYSYVFNNPTNMTDPSGFEADPGPDLGWGIQVIGGRTQAPAAATATSSAGSLASTLLGGGISALGNVADTLLWGNLGGGHAGGPLQNVQSNATPTASSGGTGGASAQAAAQNKGGSPTIMNDKDWSERTVDEMMNGGPPGGGDLIPESPSDGVTSDECAFGNCHVRHPGMRLWWNDRFGRPSENIWKIEGEGGDGGGLRIRRVVNSKMGHAAERAVEREVGYATEAEAREALQAFGKGIEQNGLPPGTVRDAAGHLVVPGFGEGGAVVYRQAGDKLTLQTVLNWIAGKGTPVN